MKFDFTIPGERIFMLAPIQSIIPVSFSITSSSTKFSKKRPHNFFQNDVNDDLSLFSTFIKASIRSS